MNIFINFPLIDKKYEISTDGSKYIYALIEEAVDAVCSKDGYILPESTEGLTLALKKSKHILGVHQTLFQAGVSDGDELILL